MQEHLAGVLLLKAAEDLDQRRLAGAVVAEQTEHLAFAQVQIDVAQCRHWAEALGDVFDAQHVVRRGDRPDDALGGDALVSHCCRAPCARA